VRALVTGSAGFVGRHLCPKLEKAGYSIERLDTGLPLPDCYVRGDFGCKSLEWFVDSKLLPLAADERFDLVIHLAANIVNVDARMKGGISMYDDIELDLAMCRWLEANPPKQCAVLMSSCAVDYPDDPYCIVKRNLECFAKTLDKKGVPVIVLRPFSGYGEDQSEEYPFRAILERALRREDPLTVWGGDQVRDWIHVEDLTDAILFAIKKLPRRAEPIEVGTGAGIPFASLARKFADAAGYCPNLHWESTKAFSSRRRVAGESGLRTLQDFGWEPQIPLDEGIRRAVASRMVSA
jgi:nucleoside-diphosphate-sugar epimerase